MPSLIFRRLEVVWSDLEQSENQASLCLTAIMVFLLFSGFSNVYHSACVWPTALKLGCVANLDTLFLVMGFISLID